MKINQQTADDLKKTISARSAALNQYNADIEEKKKELENINKEIKESKKALSVAEEEELKGQTQLNKMKKKLSKAQDAVDAEVLRIEEKHNEVIEINKEVKRSKLSLAEVEEGMNIKYEALQNRYGIIKRAIRKEMDKVRDLLKN